MTSRERSAIRITVDLPQPIKLDRDDARIAVLTANDTWIEIAGDGTVSVHSTSNQQPLWSINVVTASRLVQESATRTQETR